MDKISIYNDDIKKVVHSKHKVQCDLHLIEIVKLLARISAEKDYKKFVQEKNQTM